MDATGNSLKDVPALEDGGRTKKVWLKKTDHVDISAPAALTD